MIVLFFSRRCKKKAIAVPSDMPDSINAWLSFLTVEGVVATVTYRRKPCAWWVRLLLRRPVH